MKFDRLIDRVCELLPEGWQIRIELERDSGCVVIMRPDNSELDMHDGESCIYEQVRNALDMALWEKSQLMAPTVSDS